MAKTTKMTMQKYQGLPYAWVRKGADIWRGDERYSNIRTDGKKFWTLLNGKLVEAACEEENGNLHQFGVVLVYHHTREEAAYVAASYLVKFTSRITDLVAVLTTQNRHLRDFLHVKLVEVNEKMEG